MPIPILFAIGRILLLFGRAVYSAWKDPATRGLVYLTVLIIFVGTFVYHQIEGWGWIDSFYFTIITLTTVGYGDLAPTQPVTKIFTAVYILVGLGILASFITVIARQASRTPESVQSRFGTKQQITDE